MSRYLKALTTPVRGFFNRRFSDLHIRMDSIERSSAEAREHTSEILDLARREFQEFKELQSALLDSLAIISATLARREAQEPPPGTAKTSPEIGE